MAKYNYLSYCGKDELMEAFEDRYKEYRSSYSSPRTSSEIRRMSEYCLSPILEWFKDWETQQETDSSLLDRIEYLIEERNKPKEGGE